MKLALPVLPVLLVLLLTACGSDTPPTVEPADRGGDWVHKASEKDGKPMLWWRRRDVTLGPPRTRLYSVSWHYGTARDDGLPQEDMAPQFAKIEKGLKDALGEHAILVATVAYDRQHDWFFYVDDADVDALTKPVLSNRTLQFETGVEDDSNTEFYRELSQRMP